MPIALTCRTCGRDYEMPDDRAMWPCAGCSTMNAPPKAEGEALDKLQRALRLRTRGEFQLAEQSYNAVLVEYDDEHEALWGRVLCHYGVEFVVDEKTQRRYPLVHIPRKTLMQESADFQQACNLAPEEIRRQYEEDAAYVDDAQAEIRALAEKCPAYDVFICHKTTQLDSNAKTEDYSWAYGLYHSLDKQGYRVFFAPEELAGVAGANYEAGIYHALYTSRVMLVICSDPAYLNSTWVQSEWQRYLEMMGSEQDDTPRKLVPLLYGDMSAGRLPTAFRRRKLQAITMSNFGADAALLNVLEETCGRRGLPEPEAAEDDEFSVAEVPGGCRITGYKGDAGDLVVPEKIRGMDVVAIASGAFEDHDDLTSVILPMSVETIGEKAFKGCSRLGSVILPVELREIGNMAFNGCRSLTAVQLPETVTHIGHYAFFGCSALADMQLPEGITEIGTGVFHGCSQLERVDIPESVTEIQRTAFGSCHALQSLTLSRNIQKIARDAFGDCRSLTLRVCEDTPAHRYAMDRRLRFEMIREDAPETPAPKRPKENPDAYRIVAEKCRGCTLCVPACPEGCISGDVRKPHSINASLCTGCGACGEACMFGAVAAPVRKAEAAKPAPVRKAAPEKPKPTAPKSMPKTAPGTKITTIDLGSVPKAAPVQAKPAPVKPGPAAVAPAVSAQVTKTAVPEPAKARSVTPAGDFVTEAVEGGLSIEKYTGTQAVVEIPAVINGKPVVKIGEEAFVQNKTLRSVVIPEGVKKIGAWAFDECSALESASIPASVTEMGDNPFCRTKALQRITVAEGNPAFYTRSNVLYSRSGKLISYPCGLPGTECAIPNGVSIIGRSAFNGCKALRRVFLPDTLTEIGSLAFHATGLILVNLPARVQRLGANPFSNCPGLRGVSVAEGNEAFYERDGVLFSREGALVCYATGRSDSEYTIPSGVRAIANNAFQGNGSIMRVRIPDSVTDIGGSAFCECKSLTQIDVPESVKNLGYGCFEDCSYLTKVTLHEGLQEIHTDAFRNCEMPILDIPYSVKKVYTETFRGFKGLLRVYENSISHKVAVQKGLWHDVLRDVPAEAMAKAVASMSKDEFVAAIDKLIAGESGASEQETKLMSKIADAVNAQDFKTSPVPLGVEITAYVGDRSEVIIPERIDGKPVRGIATCAFYNKKQITSVQLPEGLTYIREQAFAGCAALWKVDIPSSVKVIGDSAFKGCTALKLPLKVKLRFMGSKLFG